MQTETLENMHPSVSDDISLSDLRKLVEKEPEPGLIVKDDEPITLTSEPAKAEITEPASGTGNEAEPHEDDGKKDLPLAVQKRIDKEIAKAVSARKEQEALIAQLKAKLEATPGPEPAKPTPELKTIEGRPVRPDEPEMRDDQTWDQHQAELKKYKKEVLPAYDRALDDWLLAEADRRSDAKQAEKRRDEELKSDWDQAKKDHGNDFPGKMAELAKQIPELLQIAVSSLENWSAVAVHLADNADERKAITDLFATNPHRAIAALGRLEASLTVESKKAAVGEKLPKPAGKVGGSTAAIAAIDLEKAPMHIFKQEAKRQLRSG